MGRGVVRLLKIGLYGLLFVAGAIGVLLWYINSFDHRARFAEAVEASTGLIVSVAGPMKITLTPLPAVVAREVHVANPPWARRAELARLDELEIGLDAWSLITGPPRLARVVVRGGLVHLETDPTGRPNWVPDPADGAGAFATPDIARLRLFDLELTYHHGATGNAYPVRFDQVRAALPLFGPMVAELDGRVRDIPVHARMIAGRLDDFLFDRRQWYLDFDAATPTAQVALRGRIDHPLSERRLDLEVEVSGMRPSELSSLAGLWLPAPEPFALTGHLAGSAGRYDLTGLVYRFADSDLSGDLTFDFTGARPAVDGRLVAQDLRLVDLVGASRVAVAPGPADGRVIDAQPLPVAALGAADARIDLVAREMTAWPMPAHTVEAMVTLADRRLVIAPLKASMAEGRLDLAITIDAAAAGNLPPVAGIKGRAEGLKLARLLPAFGVTEPPDAAMDLEVDLTGRGASLRDLLATADGRWEVTVGAGTLPIWGFDLIAEDLVQAMMPWARRSDRTPLNCMVGRFRVENGQARTGALLIDTSRITVGGTGAIDLGRETIDLVLRPRPKDPSLVSLAAPVRISGTFASQRVRPDAFDLARKGAASFILGSFNPVGALVPFIDPGTGIDNPCVAALAPTTSTTTDQRMVPRGWWGRATDWVDRLGQALARALP